MKKIFSKVAIAIAAILTIGAATLVSCNKDEEAVTTTKFNSAFPMTKGETDFQKLHEQLIAFYAACDEAYKKDSNQFITICEKNDTLAFLEITKYTQLQMSQLADLSKKVLEHFKSEYPNIKDDEATCTTCYTNALPGLGAAISATNGYMANIIPSVILRPDYFKEMMCRMRCGVLPPCSQWYCIANCMGWYYIDKYLVKVNSDDVLIGEDSHGIITYNFDIETLSKEIYENTDNEYVVETFEVLDSLQSIETGMIEIHIVLYNVKKDIPDSYWVSAKKCNGKYFYSTTAASNSGREVRCVPKNSCGKGCLRQFDQQGRFLGCLCAGNGTCGEGEYSTDIIRSIGDALSKILKAVGSML